MPIMDDSFSYGDNPFNLPPNKLRLRRTVHLAKQAKEELIKGADLTAAESTFLDQIEHFLAEADGGAAEAIHGTLT